MEQEEEKNIIIEFQRKVLQEANCTAEMLAYLDEIDDDVFREYYCICALDGMTVEEIRRIDSIAVQDWRVKIKHIKEERLNFLENIFVPNSEMQKQISELHDKAGKVFQETERIKNNIERYIAADVRYTKKCPYGTKGILSKLFGSKRGINKRKR